jgi:hypothetical protein
MFRQFLVLRAAKVPMEQAIQFGFQTSGGHRQAMGGNRALLVTISQTQALLQQCGDRHRESGGGRRGDLDHLAATPD